MASDRSANGLEPHVTPLRLTRSLLLSLLFEYGPLTWSELCAYAGLDDASEYSPAWEPLSHLIELGVVRTALMGSSCETKYKATCCRRMKRPESLRRAA